MRFVDPLRLATALAAALTIVGLQLWVLQPARAATFSAGLVFDAAAIALWWSLCEVVAVKARRAGLLFYPLLALFCVQIFAHTWFFDVAIERRLTLLDLRWSGLLHFFSVALPARGSLSLVLLFATIAGAAVLAARWLGHVSVRVAVPTAVLFGLAMAWLSSSASRVTSPLYDGALELAQLVWLPRVEAAHAPPSRALLDELDQSAVTLGGGRGEGVARYKKVFVLVMETMTARNFERESALLPRQTFVHSGRPHVQEFTRYFPNNQDSRTGMLDMLFSRLVPYEAYDDVGYAQYERLATQPSLVDRMRELGYATAFAASQTTLEEVVSDLSWSETLHLRAADLATAKGKGQLCFTPDEYEQSCEDLVLLPAVLDFVERHERAFVYQEFIWGHAAEYNEASGKSNAAYYSAYVDALLRELQRRGLADDTLIALTSDHGFRDKGQQSDLEVYRVPLLFYAPDLRPQRETGLFSHTDLGSLLIERLLPGVPRARAHALAMIVGPTGHGNLFVVESSGGHVLLRNRAGIDLLISQRGPLQHSPGALLTLFRTYRANFSKRLSAASATH
jgi:hypothetical protein